jgi:hypothetical protein
MPLDGLRAWIGEVERKLGMRTRVFLVLAVIAIGGAGAAIYLAIEAQNDAVSESDVQALQEKLEARIDESAVTGVPLQTKPEAPQPEVEPAPNGGEGGGTGSSGGGKGGTGSGSGGKAGKQPSTPGTSEGGKQEGGAATKGASGGVPPGVGELIQEAEAKNEKIEKSEGK